MVKKFYLYGNLVCTRRSLDTRRINNYLLKNNFEMVKNPKKADLIILNTCAYSNKAAKSSMEKVEEFQKYPAELIVIGCLPEVKKEELKEIFNGKTVVTKDLVKNPEKVDELFPKNKTKFDEISDTNKLWWNPDIQQAGQVIDNYLSNSFLSSIYDKYITLSVFISKMIYGDNSKKYLAKIMGKKAFFLRVSNGCLGNCSYCSIKNAIGPLQSKAISQCVTEFKRGLNEGYKIFRIVSDDLGNYGLDIKTNFIELLKEILKINGSYTIHIESISPRWLIRHLDEFEDLLKTGKITWVFSAIQSANTRILQLMNRYYTREELCNAFTALKKYHNVKLGSEAIIGFPSETNSEFMETLEFFKKFDLDMGIINQFSCMKNTIAENIKPHVDDEELLKRTEFAANYLKKIGYEVYYYKNSMKYPLNIMFFKKS
jgi:tRNA A37 methylthiotransferase MiaB